MRRPVRVPTVAAALAVSAVLGGALVGGCASRKSGADFQQPPVSAFRQGACQSMAPDILSIGRDARRLGTSATPPQDVRDALKASQDRIRAVQPSLDPDLAAPVEDLVIAVGVVRLRSDTKGFTTAAASDLSAAYQRLVDACTTGA